MDPILYIRHVLAWDNGSQFYDYSCGITFRGAILIVDMVVHICDDIGHIIQGPFRQILHAWASP